MKNDRPVLGAQLLDQFDGGVRRHDTRNAFFAHLASFLALTR